MIKYVGWSDQHNIFLNIPLEYFPELNIYYLLRKVGNMNGFADAKNPGGKFHLVQLENESNAVG